MRAIVRKLMGRIDARYQRKHRLSPLGPALHIGYQRYRGPELQFADGTVLHDNELIGMLHFNNASIAAIGDGSMQRTGFRFARLMRESLRTLAQSAHDDPKLREIRVYHGITWMPAHGSVAGFESRPLPATLHNRIIRWYLRLLLWSFAPASPTRKRAVVEPRAYWLTRQALTQNVGKLKI